MSLSKRAKEALRRAVTEDKAADELEAVILAGPHGQASHVSNIEPTANLPASNASLSTSDTYTDAAVKAAIDGAVNALGSASEARLDAIEAKIDAILAALQAAGLMA